MIDWLPEWARWVHLNPLRISCVGPVIKSSLFGHIINSLLTKHAQLRWLSIGLILSYKKKSSWPISCHLGLTLGQ